MEKNIYKVSDSETGNIVIYEGENIIDAVNEVINSYTKDIEIDGERINMDIHRNGERIYCGIYDTDIKLKELCY